MISGAWKFLTSIRLTIFLLLLIILLLIIGTLIPQDQQPDFYQKYLSRFSGLILFLKFNHLYRSPIFLSLVFLLLLNLLFCSLKQLPSRLQRLNSGDENQLKDSCPKLTPGDRLKLEHWLEMEALQLEALFKKRGFRLKILQTEDKKFFLARKGLAGLFGPELVHLGLIVIISGGLISAIFSQRISLALQEGQIQEIPGKNFALRLDKFTTEYYPDGSVRDWKSQVSVIENGRMKLQKTIEVNHPLKYERLRFFQMGYGQDWEQTAMELELKISADRVSRVRLKPEETIDFAEGYRLKAHSFLPDFRVDARGQAASGSAEPVNPAVLVEIHQAGRQIFFGWVLARHPELSCYQRSTKPELEIRLLNFSAPSFSVLEASSDPGANLVWSGCAFLLLGLLASFYFPYREVRILHQSGIPPVLMIYARKNQETFKQEIYNLLGIKKAALKD